MKKLVLTLILICLMAIPAIAGEKAVQVESLWSGITDAVGLPLSGGLVYTYQAGGSTSKATYTDAEKTTPASNPIVLDSEGKALIFADGLYKFVIKDSTGLTTLYTLDDLSYFNQYYTEAVHASDYGDGSCTDETITTAQTAIGSDVRTLVLKPCTWVVDENTAINANINLKFEAGAVLSIATGVTLTINGSIEVPQRQKIFNLTGTGAAILTNIKEAYPEWWGNNSTPGTTTMTEEIQSSLTSAKHTVLSNGVYLADNVLMSTANTSLEIKAGATLKQNGGGSLWSIKVTASDVSIFGEGTIDGNKASVAGNFLGIRVDATDASLSNVKIRDLNIKDINGYDAVYITGLDATHVPSNITVDKITATGCERNGITVIHGTDVRITNSYLKDNAATQIDSEPNTGDQLITDWYVAGNTCDGGTHGIDVAAEGARIIGNTIKNTTVEGIYITGNNKYIKVIGNTIDTCDIGIGRGTGTSNIYAVISGNTISNCTSQCIYNARIWTITGNTFVDCTPTGIHCDSSVGQNVIEGNQFISTGVMTDAIKLNSGDGNRIGYNYYSGVTSNIADRASHDAILGINRIEEHSSDFNVALDEYGYTYTNEGASSTATASLPDATVGLEYTFVAVADFDFRVDPKAAEQIRGGSGAGKYMSLDTLGDTLSLKCFVTGWWEIISSYGTLANE